MKKAILKHEPADVHLVLAWSMSVLRIMRHEKKSPTVAADVLYDVLKYVPNYELPLWRKSLIRASFTLKYSINLAGWICIGGLVFAWGNWNWNMNPSCACTWGRLAGQGQWERNTSPLVAAFRGCIGGLVFAWGNQNWNTNPLCACTWSRSAGQGQRDRNTDVAAAAASWWRSFIFILLSIGEY